MQRLNIKRNGSFTLAYLSDYVCVRVVLMSVCVCVGVSDSLRFTGTAVFPTAHGDGGAPDTDVRTSPSKS